MRVSIIAAAVSALCAFAGCIYAPLDLGLGELGKVQEVVLVEADARAKVLLLRIDGEITDSGEPAGIFGGLEATTAQVKDVLDLARKDDDIRALIVRVNSPGGGVTASDIIYRELLAWKAETRKPVVALLMDTAASGGYYVSLAADRIVAHPTCLTGSIGVIAMLPNVSGLFDKIGVKVYTVKSGARKDAGNPFRPLTDEDIEGFQRIIDQVHGRFVEVVAQGRKGSLTLDEVRKIADGRILSAQEAKTQKLVDEIGYFEQALGAAKKLAGLKDARVVALERKGLGVGRRTIYSRGFADPIGATALARGEEGDRNLIKVEAAPPMPLMRPALKYLWIPPVK